MRATWVFCLLIVTSLGTGRCWRPSPFATGPLFTNSMVETLENSDAGDAFSVGLDYKFWDSFTPR